MAIKHIVTTGIGFTVPSFIITEGFGNFTAGGGSVPSLLLLMLGYGGSD